MNLAAQDIRHNLARFGLTACGIGLLLMIVLGMGGIYRGLVYEATLLVDRVNADLWVVQRNTRGPFAEVSSVPANVENRVLAVPGVASSRRFVYWTIQRELAGRPLRLAIQGLVWPYDNGDWLPLAAGRPLGQAHYEMVADRSLGLPLGERIKLGKDFYTVVGVTHGMTSASGDGMAFFPLPDAQAIQFDEPGEAIRLQRNTRVAQMLGQDLGQQQPGLLTRVSGLSGQPARHPAAHGQRGAGEAGAGRGRAGGHQHHQRLARPDGLYAAIRSVTCWCAGSWIARAGSWGFSGPSWWSFPPSS